MASETYLQKIASQNQHNLRALIGQLNVQAGVIPFVGAGMSVDFGFRQWADFLIDQAPGVAVERVKALLSRGLYEEAAELVMGCLEPGAFQHAMEDEFGDYKLERPPDRSRKAAVRLLPRLASRHVITTNFDHALERIFRDAGRQHDFKGVISGARTQLVSRALQKGSKVLIKIHGDVEETADRVLTKSEYDRHYGAADPENIASTQLLQVMRLILMNPLLFLGCSLESDRVVAMLRRLYQELGGGLEHYAIVAAPVDDEKFLKRRAALGNMGIRPIWYAEGEYGDIEKILTHILERDVPQPLASRGKPSNDPQVEEAELASDYWGGIGALRAHQYERALEHLRRVAAVNPEFKLVQAKIDEAELELRCVGFENEATAAEASADWSTAAAALESLMKSRPGDASVARRLEHVRKQVQLIGLWDETRELHKRRDWLAVIDAFAEMKRLDPNLQDREGWLAEAQQQQKTLETGRLVKVHLQEAAEQFEAKEWSKALSALHRVLELDPGHEIARELRTQAQAEVTEAEAAALLAERYRKAVRAIAATDWNQAVELLNAVTHENPGYEDAAALLEQAAGELANAVAELDLKLTAKPSPAPPDSEVTWRLKVRNAGRVTISDITAKENGGPHEGTKPSDVPFNLQPGESKTLVFTSHHMNRGVRRHIEAEGKTPNGRNVWAEVKASVNIVKPDEPQVSTPPAVSAAAPARPPVAPAPSASRPIGVSGGQVTPLAARPNAPLIQAPPSIFAPATTSAFRDALRRAKAALALNDGRSREAVHLLEEGERHYRIAVKALTQPSQWGKQVDIWQQQVAALKLEKVEFVSLGPPAPEDILKKMARLAREIQERLGIPIPVDNLAGLSGRNY